MTKVEIEGERIYQMLNGINYNSYGLYKCVVGSVHMKRLALMVIDEKIKEAEALADLQMLTNWANLVRFYLDVRKVIENK